MTLPEGKYRVLYADPPWRYSDQRVGLGAEKAGDVDRAETVEQDYPTMSVEDLIGLDVKSLSRLL